VIECPCVARLIASVVARCMVSLESRMSHIYSKCSTLVMRWKQGSEVEKGACMLIEKGSGWAVAGHYGPFEGRGFRRKQSLKKAITVVLLTVCMI